MAERNRDVLVIGAGASGLVAAIAAAADGADVVVLEADEKPARKLLRTGNGRCNLSNAAIEAERGSGRIRSAYNDGAFVEPLVSRMGCARVRSWFSQIGLATYEDSEGRIYPVTNKARSVADVLLGECARLGVGVELDCRAVRFDRTKSGLWAAVCADGRVFRGRSLVVACGGSNAVAEAIGLPVKPLVPVLGQLASSAKAVGRLSGVRMRCVLTLERASQVVYQSHGEVLFRDHGISGIVVFDASRFARVDDVVALDLVPFMDAATLTAELERRKERLSSIGSARCSALDALDGLFAREVARTFLQSLGVSDDAPCERIDARALALLAKRFEVDVTGGPSAKDAQVMRGGVETGALDPLTLESYALPGVHVCGEAVDVDGACGGYNLHWAWVSGIAAGAAAAADARAFDAAGDRDR